MVLENDDGIKPRISI